MTDMKVYYIAWNGVPCAADGSALRFGHGFKVGWRADLTDLAVFLDKEEARRALHSVKYANLRFTIEEVEIEGVGD